MVSHEQYTAGIERLLHLVRLQCGGAEVAAQVLLSAYCGREWQLAIPHLCILDPENYQAAMFVIAGRYQGIAEPHEVIPDGERVFEDLRRDYAFLNIANRWKKDCPECLGRGYLWRSKEDYDADRGTPCHYCEGTGSIAELRGWRAKVVDNMSQ